MTAKDIVVFYDGNEGDINYPFKFIDDTFWTTQKVMASLFGVEIPAINKHLSNIFDDGELNREATISKMEIVQREGNREVKRLVDFYNLDAIIAVGYRVNSKSATQFRQWATARLHGLIMASLAESKNFKDLSEDEKRLTIRGELIKHNKSLAEAAQMAGVDSPQDYAIFQNEGYKGLYGGLGRKEIHAKKGLKKSHQILDFMGSTELAANLFRAT